MELATLLGVSQVSIHKALSNQPGVSETLRQRVQELAERHGYRPNAGAKAMRRGSFGCIALILGQSPATSLLPTLLLEGVQRALARLDQHLVLATLPDDKLTNEGYVPKILREVMADGLLINYNAQIPKLMMDLVRRHSIPSIWINSKQERDAVYPDDAQGARLGTERLIELGHRRIGYVDYTNAVDGSAWHYSARDRLAGYQSAMLNANYKPSRLGDPHRWEGGQGVTELRGILSKRDRPTALLTYSAREFRAALYAAAACQLDVPRDLSLVAVAGEPLQEAGRAASCVLLPETRIGETAVTMLMSKLAKKARSVPSEAIPCEWREGLTVAAPGGKP